MAVHHAPAQLLGRRVDQLHLVGLSHDPVGHALAHGYAGDLLDGVRDAFEMLDVDRADDADARLQDLQHVLPPLGVGPRARHVGVGELVDERHPGLAGEYRFQVHLLEARAPVLHGLARNDGQVAYLLSGELPAVCLDEADHDVGTALVTAPTLVEHRPGLADAGHRPEVDAELAGRLDQIVGRLAALRCLDHRSSLLLDPPRVPIRAGDDASSALGAKRLTP